MMNASDENVLKSKEMKKAVLYDCKMRHIYKRRKRQWNYFTNDEHCYKTLNEIND